MIGWVVCEGGARCAGRDYGGGGLRSWPGRRTLGSAPITLRFASYHWGQRAAISMSEAPAPSSRAAMVHNDSPALTGTGWAPAAAAVALAGNEVTRPGSTTGTRGFHWGSSRLPSAATGLSGVPGSVE